MKSIKESTEIYDALIIGSGITGGWAAKEFCEKGLNTLMIERGRLVEHRKDYLGEGKTPWQTPLRTKVDKQLVDEQYSVQKKCYAFSENTKHFFGNDKDLPYTTAKDTDFRWIRASQLGGKSLLWHRFSYRWSDHDFNANKSDGHGNDWPIRYKDIEDWYSYVETHVGICGQKENLEQLPDSVFLPPFDMTAPEKHVKAELAKHFPERRLIHGRQAHLTQPSKLHISQGRGKCQARNECQKGCSFGAYFSTQSSTLPDAVATGNLTIAANSVVHSLIYDEKTNRVKGVRVIDNDDLSEREYFAKIVFVCASTLGSTQILLNSRSKKYPEGLGNSSGVLGHYLMDHNYNAWASGDVDGFEDEFYKGRRPGGLYIPNFYYRPDGKRKFLRGYSLSADAWRQSWKELQGQDGFGVDFKNLLKSPGSWKFGMGAEGEMLPRYDNQVSLHPYLKDKWGIPQLQIDCSFSKNETDMMLDAAEQSAKMLKAIGLTNVESGVRHKPPGSGIHEIGTARMGRDPKDSFLNAFNQSHDIPNLFVPDGASFCSSATQNPSLTFMALTVRAVDYAVKELAAKRI